LVIERILVIDCDSYSLTFARQTLEDAGYEVLTAMDGESGLRAAFAERPDLIVLNGALVVGQDTLHYRLSGNPRTADIPLILLAPRSEVEVGRLAEGRPFQPFDPQQLLGKIAQYTFEEPSDSALISTGSAALDGVLSGGIPAGSLTLIEGEAHSGKSTLARQIIWEALQGGRIVTLFTSENTPRSVAARMGRVGADVLDFLLRGKISIYPLNLSRLGSHALQTLLHAMKWGVCRKVMVVDSLSPAVAHSSAEETRRFLEECRALGRRGTTVILTLHSHYLTGGLADSARSLCDVHLKLHSGEEREGRTATVEINKAPGHPIGARISIPFEVEPEIEPLAVPAGGLNGRRMAG
jgi:archaellum biogenesis ATPase FlaH